MDWLDKIKQGKEEMKQRCIDIALKYTPESVMYIRERKNLSGKAYRTHIEVPRPFTRKSLYIFLHECAHVILEHHGAGKKKRYIEEFEAEQWSIKTMRIEGISVPREMLARAKNYVTRKVKQAQARGLKTVNRDVKKFIK